MSTVRIRQTIKRELRRQQLKAIRERHGDFCDILSSVSSAPIEEIDELLNRGCSKENASKFVAAAASAGLGPVQLFELFESLRRNTT